MSDFNLDKEIKKWLKSFQKFRAFDEASISEMDLHLRDHIDDLISSGIEEEEAFNNAVSSFGSISSMAKEEFFVSQPYHKSHAAMISNYIKIAFRNFWKHKSFSTLNIAGLSVGLMVVFLITLFVFDELSFDQFHEKKDRLYRVVENQYYEGQDVFPVAVTPTALAPALKANYPEVVRSTRAAINNDVFQLGDKKISEGGLMVDADFFEMFTFPIIKGSTRNFEEQLNALVLTEELANKFFKDQDPIGQTIEVSGDTYEVVAVVENVPDNSHINFNYLTNFENYLAGDTSRANNWGSNWLYTYAETTKGINLEVLNEKIIGEIKANNSGSVTDIYLQPLRNIYLGEVDFVVESPRHGEMTYVKIFSVVAVFILLLSCINFMNLTTARSSRRAKEIGLRKTVGAGRAQLIIQFLSESIILSLISVFIASILVLLVLPYFNQLSGKNFDLVALLASINVIKVVLVVLLTATVTGLCAGSYPAIFLSAILPSQILKGHTNVVRGGKLRKVLVTLQFAVSVTLIIGTMVVYKQFQFIQEIDLGYDKEDIAFVFVPGQKSNLFAEEVSRLAGVMNVGQANRHPGYVLSSSSGFSWKGKNPDETMLMHYMSMDESYIPTMNMRLNKGRNFLNTDSAAVIINERAAELMGMNDPIGQTVTGSIDYKIVGVLNNFNFKSIHTAIEPIIIFKGTNLGRVFMKYDPQRETELHARLEAVWTDLIPDREFSLSYLETDFSEMYEAEERTGNLTAYFAILAILISCLGLYGLVAYAVEQRKKEIGVRKVLGASVPKLFMLLAFDFSRLILVSLIFSLPLGWYLMSDWLETFAYRVDLSPWILVISALIAIIITFLTVSYQSFKASMSNPVRALRTE